MKGKRREETERSSSRRFCMKAEARDWGDSDADASTTRNLGAGVRKRTRYQG